MMLKVLMLLLAVRKVFRSGRTEVEHEVFMTSDYCHKPPSATPHSASPPGNHRTGSGDGPGGPDQFTRCSSFAYTAIPNLHSAYLGDSGPLEDLCEDAVVVAFCSCLPAV